MEGHLKEAFRRYVSRDWEGALASLRDLDSTDENYIDLAYLLGLCHARLGHWDDSLLYLEQVVTSCPDMMRIFQCRLALAYVYSVTERHRLAEYELGRLVESGFKSVQVLSFLGYSAWKLGRKDDATRWYGRALELDPESATALNGMGYVLACEGMDCPRALTLCRKAVDMKPENPAYLDSLAWAYYRLGFFNEARDYIKRALGIAPDLEEIRNHAREIDEGAELR